MGAISGRLVKALMHGYRFHPTAGGFALFQLAESFIGLQKDFLGNVLCFAFVGNEAHGGTKYHVLVVLHEQLELFGIRHLLAVLAWCVYYAETGVGSKALASSYAEAAFIYNGAQCLFSSMW